MLRWINTTKGGVNMGFTFGFGAAAGDVSGDSGSDVSAQSTASLPGADKELGFNRDTSQGSVEYSEFESNFVGKQSTIEGGSKVNIYVDGNTHLKGSTIVVEEVTEDLAWAWDQLKPIDNYLKNMKTKPVNIKLGYEKKEQIANATIGAGDILIRNNPGQDISNLNRDAHPFTDKRQ